MVYTAIYLCVLCSLLLVSWQWMFGWFGSMQKSVYLLSDWSKSLEDEALFLFSLFLIDAKCTVVTEQFKVKGNLWHTHLYLKWMLLLFLKVPLVTLDADVDFVVSESCVASGHSFTFWKVSSVTLVQHSEDLWDIFLFVCLNVFWFIVFLVMFAKLLQYRVIEWFEQTHSAPFVISNCVAC